MVLHTARLHSGTLHTCTLHSGSPETVFLLLSVFNSLERLVIYWSYDTKLYWGTQHNTRVLCCVPQFSTIQRVSESALALRKLQTNDLKSQLDLDPNLALLSVKYICQI